MKRIIALCIVAISLIANAQDKKSTNSTVFKTDITCQNCEAKIMKQLPYEKGVKEVVVDVERKLVTVTYKQSKNTDEQLGKAIEKLGYQATFLGHPNYVSVKGNCDMCKARIEEAAMNVMGVSMAVWNVNNQELNVIFDESQLDLKAIESAIAKAGHDTQNIAAKDESYKSLPDCCKYRK
ncbi:heavy-metal-associated domain-containing protein [Carboxylicivirga sp. N1Y90]|uniref:heavy-metal-associated domain-containing protein n=1 Tax=Carboxylicivirga fragile TaxID=3417571 RepID=UPI003D34E497|nr:heavy-metal-associated domain-containing protein [Marinilabiliaceae bacterium N1Y90]